MSCTHIKTRADNPLEIPKSLWVSEDYVLVGNDCPKNTSPRESKYFFLKKTICDKCQAEKKG